MSSIKTTQIDGDVSVGRNVMIGGKADIAGSVSIGHNLKVDGWLEAPNIKGANKGIFLTVQELREAYPVPHDGWMAGVGASTPFTAYVGKGGDWVATGGTIEVTVDMSQYTEGVAQLQEDIDEVAARVQTAETNIASHTQQLTTLGNQLNNVQEAANTLNTENTARKAEIKSLENRTEELESRTSTLESRHTEDVTQLQEDTNEVAARVQTAETNIASHTQQITDIGQLLTTTHVNASNALNKAVALEGENDARKAEISSLEQRAESLEKASGELDEVIPVRYWAASQRMACVPTAVRATVTTGTTSVQGSSTVCQLAPVS